jgi:cytochrome P450
MSNSVQTAAMMLFSPAGREDPYPFYATLREAGAVLPTPFGGMMVTRYDAVDRVLRSPAFRTPRGYRDADDPAGPPRFDPNTRLALHRKHWVIFQSGDAHTRLRKLIMKVFTPRAVRALGPRIESLVDELVGAALARGSMEVICELLGIPPADRDRNRALAAAVAITIDPMVSDAQIAKATAAMEEWDAYIRALLAERRRAPGDALLDAMLAVEEDGTSLTEDEVAANATFLFLAGHETTTNLIGNGLYWLLRRPEQLARLRAEPGLVENAIEELLRYESPVQFAPRVALERMDLEGVTLEPERPLMVALGSANRDPRRYERPDELDIARPDPKPLSFGGGPHYCVGAALARIEAKHAFAALAARTCTIDLVSERAAWRPVLMLRGLSELRVTLSVP